VVLIQKGTTPQTRERGCKSQPPGDESPSTPYMAPKASGKDFPETIPEHLKSLLCDHHCCSLESNLTELSLPPLVLLFCDIDAGMLLKCPLTADATEL